MYLQYIDMNIASYMMVFAKVKPNFQINVCPPYICNAYYVLDVVQLCLDL